MSSAAKVGINEDVLAVAEGGCLFYPCAGRDWDEFIQGFAPAVEVFWFCDPAYDKAAVVPVRGFRIAETTVRGDPKAVMSQASDGSRTYRHLTPCLWSSRMTDEVSGRPVTVNRRRGFGEYALALEFADRSISVFVHRGDTMATGEASSGSCFLGRRTRDHEPLSLLFDKLSRKLRDTALIVSDGSNTDIRELRRFHGSRIEGEEAYARSLEHPFTKWGFDWRCVGYLGRRYGPTLIWQTRRLSVA